MERLPYLGSILLPCLVSGDNSEPQVDFTITNNNGDNNVLGAGVQEEKEDKGDQQRCMELLTANPQVNWNFMDPEDGDTPLLHCIRDSKVKMAKMYYALHHPCRALYYV